MAKQKYYVVWEGVCPGIYTSWTDCQLQIKGYEGAKYKSFETHQEAEQAFASSPFEYIGKRVSATSTGKGQPTILHTAIIDNSLAVDAACSGNPGPMEYQGVYVANRQQLFHFGPVRGTNNIGEFLALVHGLALIKQQGYNIPVIYSDSVNAINWVRNKKCKTKLERTRTTEELFLMIERAEKWLKENSYTTRILKWETKIWGEIPADFGRK